MSTRSCHRIREGRKRRVGRGRDRGERGGRGERRRRGRRGGRGGRGGGKERGREGRKGRGGKGREREGKGSRCQYLQWNLSNTDTLRTISEVSLFQRENKFGKCCLTRCPYFRGVL